MVILCCENALIHYGAGAVCRILKIVHSSIEIDIIIESVILRRNNQMKYHIIAF